MQIAEAPPFQRARCCSVRCPQHEGRGEGFILRRLRRFPQIQIINQKKGNQEMGRGETRWAPASLGATHRAFAFYLGNPFPRFLRS